MKLGDLMCNYPMVFVTWLWNMVHFLMINAMILELKMVMFQSANYANC